MSRTPKPPAPGPNDRLLLYTGGSAEPASDPFADSELPRQRVADLDELVLEAERGVGAVVVLRDGLEEDGLEQLDRYIGRHPRLQNTQIYLVARTAEGDQKPVPQRLADRKNVGLFGASTGDRALGDAITVGIREERRQTYLDQVLQSLEEVEQREERLLATIGHELRNPLAVLATSISVVRRREEVGPSLGRQLATMERQVHALTRKVDEMLHTTREHQEGPLPDDLPTRRTPSSGPDAPDAAHGSPILVVEDHEEGRALLVELLELWGYTVAAARDGREGIDKAREVRPTVALLDVDLPELDGHQLARLIREERGDEPVCLIAMSGFGSQEDRLRALAAGFDYHLVKPVDPVRLANLLDASFRAAERAH